METMPTWALTISYWIHLLATVIWLGGMVSVALFILPYVQNKLPLEDREPILSKLQGTLNSIGWFCLFLLAGTGMFQMSANPSYLGFLAIDNNWAIAILLKHIVIVVMVIAMGYLAWFVIPELKRISLRRQMGKEINLDELSNLRQKEKFILWTNLILAILVLIFTAWARSAS